MTHTGRTPEEVGWLTDLEDIAIDTHVALTMELNTLEKDALSTIESRLSAARKQLVRVRDKTRKFPDIRKEANKQLEALDLRWALVIKVRGDVASKRARTETTSTSSHKNSGSEPSSRIKRNDLPTFDGSPTQWSYYHATMKRLIFDQKDLSDADKFRWLWETLPNRLRDDISFIDPDKPDLARAIQELKRKFQDPGQIYQEVESRIEGCPLMSMESTTIELRKFRDLVINITNRVRGFSKDAEYQLLQKLTKKLSMDLALRLAEEAETFQELLDKLLKYVKSVEKLSRGKETSSAKSSKPTAPRKSFSRHGNRFSHPPFKSAQVNNVQTQSCVFCQTSAHPSKECPKSPYERKAALLRNRTCFRCLEPYDRNNHRCKGKCSKCNHPSHHALICRSIENSQRFNNSSETSNKPKIQSAQLNLTLSKQHGPNQTFFNTLLVKTRGKTGSLTVRVLLDSGADASFVSSRLIRRANISTKHSEPTKVTGIFATTGEMVNRCATLEIESLNNHYKAVFNLRILQQLSSKRIRPISKEMHSLAQKSKVRICDDSSEECIDLLIGQDLLEFHFYPKNRILLRPGLAAYESNFGWYLGGVYDENNSVPNNVFSINSLQSCPCSNLNAIFGIEEETEEQPVIAMRYHEEGKRYFVKLPFVGKERPKDNRQNALFQVKSLRARLDRSELLVPYHEAITDYVRLGHAEIAPKSASMQPGFSDSYYLPHSYVLKPTATKTKLRVVFNASSAIKNAKSLNDCLRKGAPLHCNLWESLMNFRLALVPMLSDLVKAFLQIRIEPEDRKYLRYFWYSNLNDAEPTVYHMNSVLFGATASPHLLGAVIKHHLAKHWADYPLLSKANLTMYVDDLFLDVETPEDAPRLVAEVKELFKKASFELHDWITPSREAAILSPPELMVHHPQPGEVRTCLGVSWRVDTDQLMLTFQSEKVAKLTRRNVLQYFSRLYDPMDLLLPFKVRIRRFLRELAWRVKNWDDEIEADQLQEFEILSRECELIRDWYVPRAHSCLNNLQVMIFCDASLKAMGVVAYVISVQNASPFLLCAKGRLTPAKVSTVPRLELNAAVMGANLGRRLKSCARLAKAVFQYFTDSLVTLHRILSTPNRFDNYVEKRLVRILEDTQQKEWCYVETAHNPADLVTRGISITELRETRLWWNGPPPSVFQNTFIPPLDSPLEYSLKINTVNTTVNQPIVPEGLLARSYLAACRTAVLAFRMLEKRGYCMDQRNQGKQRQLSLTSYANLAVWKLLQQTLFSEDLTKIRAQRYNEIRPRLRKVLARCDEWGVLRANRRLPETYSYDTRNPIIIGDHPFVRHYIWTEHKRLEHAGVDYLFGHITERFWLPRARDIIRAVIGSCMPCNRLKGKAFTAPEPPLPEDRATPGEPFQVCGLDYFGPVATCQRKKIYGLLFTCAVTRAIHIEPVTSLNTGNCLLAIQRFIYRRGIPSKIYSDNAGTFVAVNRAMVRMIGIIRQCSDLPSIAELNIEWSFQAPRAPWWGGFFERMVGSVKRALTHTNLKRFVRLEQIWTVFAKAEAIVNSRPLTSLNADSPPLTPAHFFGCKRLMAFPPLNVPLVRDSDTIRKYQEMETLYDNLWHRWTNLYIRNLRQQYPPHQTREPKEGEMVVIQDTNRPRMQWPIGRIEEVFMSRDNNIRLVRIRFPNGNVLARAVQQVIPLEIPSFIQAGGGGCHHN